MTLRFQIQGSADEPYVVIFSRSDNNNLTGSCTCKAGMVGQYCKHRFALLDGDVTNMVGDNHAEVALLAEWLPGSDVASAIASCKEAETLVVAAQAELSRRKKILARALND